MELIKYDRACKAIAEARTANEAKNIRDTAEALRVYAKQAQNRQLELDALEIRWRAERRVGELIRQQKETVGLNKGQLRRGTTKEPREQKPTLADAGIDKKLSARSQKIAAVPAGKFETMVSQWREKVSGETERVTTNILRKTAHDEPRDLPKEVVIPEGKFSSIVVDPPWSYSNKSGRHGDSSNADYIQNRTMTLDQVAAFDIQRWVADDCHLYLWVTDAYVGHVYSITEAWGFSAKATLVWVKDRFGMGNYYRHQHELCVFAVKGKMRLKRMNASTVFKAPVTKHSEKPDVFYRLVESCSPGPYLDVFARKRRAGWSVFGDEVTPEYQTRLEGSNESAHVG